MITKAQIDRINYLAHKAKSPEGLTALEKAEQARLRKEYIAAFHASTEAALSRVEIRNPDGTIVPLKKKE